MKSKFIVASIIILAASILALPGCVEGAPTPSTIYYTDVTENSVALGWIQNQDADFARYELYRITSIDPIIVVKIAEFTNRNQTTFTDTNLANQTRYWYALRTYDTSGVFVRSNTVGVYTRPPFQIPNANISVNGDFSDWQGIQSAYIDAAGDSLSVSPGTDFTNFYFARDGQYLYVRFDLANGLPEEGAEILYQINLDLPPRSPMGPGDTAVFFWNFSDRSHVTALRLSDNQTYQDQAALAGSSIEMRVSLDFIGNPTHFFTCLSIGEGVEPGGGTHWVDSTDLPTTEFVARLAPATLPLSTRAANLAKELVNHPEAYLTGGKGWDYNLNEFVSSANILSGYTYWNQVADGTDFGVGLDCSGLIMWAYNRSFDPKKSRFNNFVKAEGADEQFRYNTEPTTETDLKPGDVMFFDWGKWDENTQRWDGVKDGYIDHVAMYVGESGGFDVVNASSRSQGIIGASRNVLKQLSGFNGFKQVISALPLAVLATTHSPVDLVVTDPDGFTIAPTTIISSELEFLRQIPGVLYYSEMEKGADGRPIDQVYSYVLKTGNYLITVLPEPDVLPTDTYTLKLESLINGEAVTTVLAENIPISEIPKQPYLVKITETEVIPAVLMRSFSTKKMLVFWGLDCPEAIEKLEEIDDFSKLEKEYQNFERKLPKTCFQKKNSFTVFGSFELPDGYKKEGLDKSSLFSIRIADKLGKDKVNFKELKNLWLYQEPWKWQKTDDSLGQGMDIKTMSINWLSGKEKSRKNWFYARGELSLVGIDVNTLPKEATLILEIPVVASQQSGILAGIEMIEFKKSHNSWLYNSLIKWKDWRDGWWKKWGND